MFYLLTFIMGAVVGAFAQLVRMQVRPKQHVHSFGPWKFYGNISRPALKDEQELVKGIAQTRECSDATCKYIEFDSQEI